MSQHIFETPSRGLKPTFAEPGMPGEVEATAPKELEVEPTFEAHVAVIGLQLHKDVVAASRSTEALLVDYVVAQGNID